MKSTIFIAIILTSSLVYGQRGDTGGRSLPKGPEATETKRPSPKKPSVDMAEFIFKRIDSNHDGSISLKEFKVALPRLRQSPTRSGQGPTRSTQGRTRGFDGKAPSFRPDSSPHSRGNSRSRGRSSRSSRGKSK